jgi:hypothetical protein
VVNFYAISLVYHLRDGHAVMIYVDNMGIPAKVWNKRTGRYVESHWYHLISDKMDPAEELHEFAARLGLHYSYFQEGRSLGGTERNPGHDHYDLTIGKRKQAIALGAKPITTYELGAITMAKTQTYRDNLPWMRLVGAEWL